MSALADWVIGVIAAIGYPGVLLLMAVESACIPLPSEIIMPFAGSLVAAGRFNLWLVATAGALGCNLGSVVAYEIGRRGGRAAVNRFGRWVLLGPEDIDRAQRFFEHYGGAAVFLGRLAPGVRSFIALPAGVASMPRLRFHVYTFLGSWPWCLGLAYAGDLLGQRWRSDPRIAHLFHRFDIVLAALIALGLALFLWRRLRRGKE